MLPGHSGEKRQIEGGESEDHEPKDHHHRHHVKAAGGPDMGPDQRLHLEFQTHRKEQQRDADLGDLLERVTARHTQGIEQKAGDQKTHQRRQVYKTGSKAEYKGERDPADVAKGGAYPVPIHKRARGRVTNEEDGRILSDEVYATRKGGEAV